MTKEQSTGHIVDLLHSGTDRNCLTGVKAKPALSCCDQASQIASTARRTGMDRAVARASQAYRDNEVALDDGHEPKDHSVEHHTAVAAVQPSGHSARNLHHVKSAKNLRTAAAVTVNLRTAAAVTVNLRDCGTISRILRQGRMFRSSQVMRYFRFHRCSLSG